MNPNQIQPEDVDPSLVNYRAKFSPETLKKIKWAWEVFEESETPLNSHFSVKGNKQKTVLAYVCIRGRSKAGCKVKGYYRCLVWYRYHNDPDEIPDRGFMGTNDFFKPVPIDRILSFFMEPVPDTRDSQ